MTTLLQKKTGPYADVLMDRWFKRTFGWAPAKRLMKLFLQELIPEREIRDLSFGPTEHINPIEEGKDVRVDVECTDTSGARFMVEMQLGAQSGFYNRAVFNSSFGIQSQVLQGASSRDFPPVYFVGVLNFVIHKGSDKVLFRYSLQENDTHELMTDKLQYLMLELPNCTKALTPRATLLDNFCYALHNIGQMERRPDGLQGEIFDLLFNSAEIAKFDANEQAKYFEDMTKKEDIQAMVDFAERKGVEKGMEKGMEKGIEKGIQQTARRLLDAGAGMELIQTATGFSAVEIQALKSDG